MTCPCEHSPHRCSIPKTVIGGPTTVPRTECIPCRPNKNAAYHEGGRQIDTRRNREGEMEEVHRCIDCGAEWTC